MSVSDSRVWLLWGAAAGTTVLAVRDPLVIIAVLSTVITVRITQGGGQSWGWLVRIALVLVAVGVLFNALTVHAGETVLLTLPPSWPMIGGVISLNAVIYGVVSAISMLTLVLLGTTVAGLISWSALMAALPRPLLPIAMAGSVSWAFLPGISRSFVDIRETQLARGLRITSPRASAALVVPLLERGMEYALTMAEALEARGIGAGPTVTRYRQLRRSWLDTLVALASLAMIALVMIRVTGGHAPSFNPYPRLVWPQSDAVIAWAALGLLLPAVGRRSRELAA